MAPPGSKHQIDVVVNPKDGFSGSILVSCKSSKDVVGIEHVRAWADIAHQTGAAAGVIVSPTGFTSGAVDAARAPARRVSLWMPRALTDADFAPNDGSSDGYLRNIGTTFRIRQRRAREGSFVFDVESASGKREGLTLTFTFSAETRDLCYLRDERDNVVGNLWDDFLAAGKQVPVSGPVRVEPTEPRFLVVDRHRVRFKSLTVHIDVVEFEAKDEIDFAKLSFAYENAATGAIKMVPLPPSMLGEGG